MREYKFGTYIEVKNIDDLVHKIMYDSAMKAWGVFIEPTSIVSKNSRKVRTYEYKLRPKQQNKSA